MDNKTEYTYTYANGDTYKLTVGEGKGQVSEEWIRILHDLDRQEYNNIHSETRRHCSLNALDPDEYYLPTIHDGFDDCNARELWEVMKQMLTDREKEIAERVFMEGYSIKETAKICRLSDIGVYKTLDRIRKKIKKYSF